MTGNIEQYLDWVRWVLRTEALGLNEVADALDGGFVRAVDALLHCKGRVVIISMGKSGHVGQKIAATMVSTGTSMFFIHPIEAVHGDLGMIVDNGVVVAISNSGESDEITAIMSAFKRKNAALIDITARPAPASARRADIHTTAVASKEVCLLGLAPITSTTAVMAFGDALAVVLLRACAFTPDDFALSHSVGNLGKRLLLRVADIMHGDDVLPAVISGTLLREAIVCMSEKGLGMLAVTDGMGRLKGVLTNGDLCHLFQQRDNFAGLIMDDIMHTSPKAITTDKLATEALKRTQANYISGLLVIETDGTLTGVLGMHDLSMARIV